MVYVGVILGEWKRKWKLLLYIGLGFKFVFCFRLLFQSGFKVWDPRFRVGV